MPQAVILNALGGPEQLSCVERPAEPLKPSEIRVNQQAIGVNYIDTYFRRGLYVTELPAVLGDQAVGTVIECGTEVNHFNVGDRISYASVFGAYQQQRCLDPNKVVKLPDNISALPVAATLTRGLTAEYLLFRLHAIKPGQTIIVHAAAGGTGIIMSQWAKFLGATVIGTVGTPDKVTLAKQHGCDYVLVHSDPAFVDNIREITKGRLVDVVYDSIGKDTFERSLQCIKPRGLMVAFGNASGKPEEFDVLNLARLGSLFLTRPILSHYIGTRADFELSTERYFDALLENIIVLPEISEFPLSQASAAHRHLEDRTKLSIPVLIPEQ